MKESLSFFEVEIKARIKSPSEIERRVRRIAEHAESYTCHDTYFTFADTTGYQDQRFRLRRKKDQSVVTAKERKKLAGVEANLEHEFTVDDPDVFKEFARVFGFRVLIKKTKEVRKFRYTSPDMKSLPGTVSIELNNVKGLGHFIEIEALVKKAGEMKKAQAIILSILDRLEITRDQIELIPYTRLLYDKKSKKPSYKNPGARR